MFVNKLFLKLRLFIYFYENTIIGLEIQGNFGRKDPIWDYALQRRGEDQLKRD
jgi:hypothetical protein